MRSFFRGKKVLITGACGTFGRELACQLLEEYSVGHLVGLDVNELGTFSLGERLTKYDNAQFLLGDIRDVDFVRRQMKDIDIVFHTASFADICLCEESPFEAVHTNIIGVQNVIDAVCESGVERVVLISSHKAVNPISVMGTSKLMSEQLITTANSRRKDGRPILASIRLGHVLGARGSVLPVFWEQIRRGGPVTLTHPYMARFMISGPEAAKLALESAGLAKGGEVFIAKMPVVRIVDLAEVMIDLLAPTYGQDPAKIAVEIIGLRPGEKIFEELMTQEETTRACELERFFVVYPEFSPHCRVVPRRHAKVLSAEVNVPYNSEFEKPLTKKELTQFLVDSGLLQDALQSMPKILN